MRATGALAGAALAGAALTGAALAGVGSDSKNARATTGKSVLIRLCMWSSLVPRGSARLSA